MSATYPADENEAEAVRTAQHLTRTNARHVAFYGLFYVRRPEWPKDRRWAVWERAMDIVNGAGPLNVAS